MYALQPFHHLRVSDKGGYNGLGVWEETRPRANPEPLMRRVSMFSRRSHLVGLASCSNYPMLSVGCFQVRKRIHSPFMLRANFHCVRFSTILCEVHHRKRAKIQ